MPAIVLVLLLLAASPLPGAPQNQPDERLAASFLAFYNLDYDTAIAGFEAAAAADPGSAELQNHVAQGLLYRELYRNGSLETQLVSGNNSFLRRAKVEPQPDVEKKFFTAIDRSLAISRAKLARNSKDTAAMHASGVAHGLRGNYNFLVRKAWKDALSDATEARKIDARVLELDPSFIDAKMIPGLHDYIVGSLSWTYRTLGFLAGFHGDRARGLKTIEEVYHSGRTNRVDAQILLCVLYRREGHPKLALPLLEDLIRLYPQNYLFRFEQAQMYSLLGERTKAIGVMDELTQLKQSGVPGFDRVPWEKIWFQKGNFLFWFNDLDRSLENLKKVTATPRQVKELDLNTGVLAYMRQGQIYDLKNQHELAVKQYELAINFAPEAEAARESRHYISTPYDRNSKWRP